MRLARTTAYLIAAVATAQVPIAAQEPIADNSFLIEEAYNQEAGVVQHIFTFENPQHGGDWTATFTQEWPAPNQRHQLSYTLERLRDDGGVGDVALNYRYQILGIGGGPVAFAPRLSVVLPTGDERLRQTTGEPVLELNLPLSIELRPDFIGHWNLGASHSWAAPGAKASSDDRPALSGWHAGQGLVWLVRPRVNLLFEALWERADQVSESSPGRAGASESFTLSPGVRLAFDLPSGLQIVPGLAVPIGVGPSSGDRGVFLYLSLEHPFRR